MEILVNKINGDGLKITFKSGKIRDGFMERIPLVYT